MSTQQTITQSPAVIKAKLEVCLRNGPEGIELAARQIKQYNLPYFIEVSNGDPEKYPGIPEGFGILRDSLSRGELHLQRFVTVEKSTLTMKEDARKVSNTPHEVLIIGETGTGKEIIASSMIGERKGAIKAVNCAGFVETLIESELFGHVKGAFTGAEKDKTGFCQAAEHGVMFLDEIGELPMSVQAKLLRALQEKRVRKVGSTTDEAINCKFVFATHRNLEEMVEAGTFRKDLFARISTLTLNIKPLRGERRCDIIPICKSIIEGHKISSGAKFLQEYGKDLEEGTIDVPLNVRSLQQYIIRYDILGRIK